MPNDTVCRGARDPPQTGRVHSLIVESCAYGVSRGVSSYLTQVGRGCAEAGGEDGDIESVSTREHRAHFRVAIDDIVAGGRDAGLGHQSTSERNRWRRWLWGLSKRSAGVPDSTTSPSS